MNQRATQPSATTGRVRDNAEQSRYELVVDGQIVGFADYWIRGDTVVFPHTVITPALRGRGLGEELVGAALADVARSGRKVEPLCWFVAEYLETHPDTPSD
jgi:predicted GNAT family acetyltransferase